MSKETEKLTQSLRSQHKRPDVDDILASFIKPSAGLHAEPATVVAPPATDVADQSISASPAEPLATSPVSSEAEAAELKAELRLHAEPAPTKPPKPSRTARRPRQTKSKAKTAPQATATDKPLVSNIPTRAFFRYYNFCQDEILRRIPSKTGKLLISRLFRLSFGFNRNWCRVSMESLANHVGADQTNHIRAILKAELGQWIHLLAKGDRRGPSLWMLDFGDEVTHPWDIDGVKVVSEDETFEHQEMIDEGK